MIRAYEVATEAQNNLQELERRYIILQMKIGARHGAIFGLIIFLNLKMWGIV